MFFKLCKKNNEFNWTNIQQAVFDNLKNYLAKDCIVKIFYPEKDVTLTMDARKYSILAILTQEKEALKH